MKRLLSLIALCVFALPVYAKQYVSSMGFTIDIPSDWLVMSAQEAKSNADMFSTDGSAFKNMDPHLLQKIKDMIQSGRVELYFNQETKGGGFADNVNMSKQLGRLPTKDADLKPLCSALPGELSRAFGRRIKMFRCALTSVDKMPALLTEFDGAVANTRVIQYQIQLTPNVKLLATATSKINSLPRIRSEFDAMVGSIRPTHQDVVH